MQDARPAQSIHLKDEIAISLNQGCTVRLRTDPPEEAFINGDDITIIPPPSAPRTIVDNRDINGCGGERSEKKSKVLEDQKSSSECVLQDEAEIARLRHDIARKRTEIETTEELAHLRLEFAQLRREWERRKAELELKYRFPDDEDEGTCLLSPPPPLPVNEKYNKIVENPFVSPWRSPLSTFSANVDTASYTNVRRFLRQGQLPPPDAVRIEELVNYFRYEYAKPSGDSPFSANAEVAACPWALEHRLARIGIQGREVGRDERPASNLVFLIDVSGSMDEPNKLPLVKSAMKMLLEKLGENDRAGIVTYADNARVALNSRNCARKSEISEAIDELSAGGCTNGGQGIQLAYAMAQEHFISGGSNRIILCTDGDFNVGMISQDELVKLVGEKKQSGVTLSVFGFGMGNLKDAMLEKLAQTGGGNYAYIDSREEAHKALARQISGTLVTIAKDVKLQVEFNPALVRGYRLIGYEHRELAARDFNNDWKDGGEIGAAHTVTALYEIIPASHAVRPEVDPLKYQSSPRPVCTSITGELLTVKIRYKHPDGNRSAKFEFALDDNGCRYEDASRDFKFASAVACFGLLLRHSPYVSNVSYDDVINWAHDAKGSDRGNYRSEFINLVETARALRD
jgi:Ca-activated chloride channel family protein